MTQYQALVNRIVAGWVADESAGRRVAMDNLANLAKAYLAKSERDGDESARELGELLTGVHDELKRIGEAWTDHDLESLWEFVKSKTRKHPEALQSIVAQTCFALLVELYRQLPDRREAVEALGSRVRTAVGA